MLRRMVWPTVLTALLVGLIPAYAEPLVRRETSILGFEMDAVVIDRKGVRTELASFGRMFGTGSLAAHHGDAEIQIPFEKIREFRIGVIKDTRADVQVRLEDSTTMLVEIDTHEYTTTFTGTAAFGKYRIMLGKIASCRLTPILEEEPDLVWKACGLGHRWSQEDYRYCPYDGKPLEAIVRKTRDELKEDK